MRHLNYNHLLYFYTVAREGSVARAAKVLHLTPQTVSGQIKLLEDVIGEPLFLRVGRGLTLSDTGRVVQTYADEIFSVGTALAQRLKSDSEPTARELRVGIVDSFPKLVACKILSVTLSSDAPAMLSCSEGKLDSLLADLSVHKLVVPRIVAEFDDSALMKTFGESELGAFAAPNVIADDVSRCFKVRQIGMVEGLKETFTAISPQRRLRHPSVLSIAKNAAKFLETAAVAEEA